MSHCRNREGLTINIGENGRNGAQARCQKGHKSCSGKMCKITTMKCCFGLCDCLNSVAKNTGFTYLIFSIVLILNTANIPICVIINIFSDEVLKLQELIISSSYDGRIRFFPFFHYYFNLSIYYYYPHIN